MKQYEIKQLISEQELIINDCKGTLKGNDYKNLKNIEAQLAGVELPYDPQEVYNGNKTLRDQINAAEAEIARLEAIEPEVEPVEGEESAEEASKKTTATRKKTTKK